VDLATWQWVLIGIGLLVAVVAVHDLLQRRHSILRTFPVVGHLRFLLEAVGPELRQYIVTDNDGEKPFSRDERRWIYASAKAQENRFGFGTDNDLERTPGYIVVKHHPFPHPEPPAGQVGAEPDVTCPSAKVVGGPRGRPGALRLPSVVQVSSMSFGSLSGAAVRSLNAGAGIAGCLHGTGEGGPSPHHLQGGDLIWQIGTGYFGCRDVAGRFDRSRFLDTLEAFPVRAVEIKLSQGAKPGLGGLLPGAKVTPEIAAARGVPPGVDCHSPPAHSAFRDVDSMLDFVEELADLSGLPVGIKSAVGSLEPWVELADRMVDGSRGVDFVVIDGGEGGTGAAPLVFADHVALPFFVGFSRVQRTFAERGVADRLTWVGSGRLGLPARAVLAFALGCDAVNVGREALLSIGCIQAQRCHTGRCPAGITSQSRWLERGVDPADKSARAARYLVNLRREILALSRACGVAHPALVTAEDVELLDEHLGSRTAAEVFGYQPGWGEPAPADLAGLSELLAAPAVHPSG
jgi:glutamate synthase domain-containing protein 2